jgi:pyruvate formate lyase activating enzyme
VTRDRPFFEASGGGITFSGGEPLSQPAFLAACLRECRSRGLHTAVDTCGAAARETVLEIAALADLVLYDLKLMDSGAHLRHTGTGNDAILDNLRALSAGTAEIRVRVPLVPGINDGAANLEAMAAFLGAMPRRHPVDILPYHRTAAAKTARLAGGRSFSGFGVPGPGALAAARAWFERVGLETTIGGSQ